jgi:hypothetical protein
MMILPQENSFRQKKFHCIFQAVSAVPKEIYSGSLPTTIVLDKYGIMRLHHEGFANYDGKSLIYRQLLEE